MYGGSGRIPWVDGSPTSRTRRRPSASRSPTSTTLLPSPPSNTVPGGSRRPGRTSASHSSPAPCSSSHTADPPQRRRRTARTGRSVRYLGGTTDVGVAVALRVDDVDLSRDRALVERYQSGDSAAFDELYRRYYHRLERFCRKRVGDSHE